MRMIPLGGMHVPSGCIVCVITHYYSVSVCVTDQGSMYTIDNKSIGPSRSLFTRTRLERTFVPLLLALGVGPSNLAGVVLPSAFVPGYTTGGMNSM